MPDALLSITIPHFHEKSQKFGALLSVKEQHVPYPTSNPTPALNIVALIEKKGNNIKTLVIRKE
jgi:hypothetical protein